MSKTLLVTGAFGFIGRNVAKHFANAGWTVVGIGHGSWTRKEWRQWGISDWHTTDVTPDALLTYAGSPEAVIHCAGSGSVGFSMTHPLQDFQRTVMTTIAVMEFVRLHAPQAHVVLPSSAGVYGVVETLPIAESAPLVPVSPYGVHKKLSEEICKSYADHFGVTVTVLRLFSVYGAGLEKQLLWDACNKITRGEYTFFGSGNELRDWIHVSDVASLMEHVIVHSSEKYSVYNGATGLGVSVADILKLLFTGLGVSSLPSFSGISKPGDPAGYVADIGKANNALNWKPVVSWQDKIAAYAEWFRKTI